MGIEIVVIDHHTAKTGDVVSWENISIPLYGSREEFFEGVSSFLHQRYDLVYGDQDPDGAMASAIYALGKEQVPDIVCMRGDLDSGRLAALEERGVEKVLCLDWFGIYDSDLSEAKRVTLLNPVYSGLPHELCATQIVYESMRPSIDPALQETAMTLAAIGIVSDYCVGEAHHIIRELATGHPDLFADVITLLDNGQLTRYSVFRTGFDSLSDMAWAPYIFDGDRGAEKMISLIAEHSPFTVRDLFSGSENPAARYLHEQGMRLQEVLAKEWKHLEKTAEIDDTFIIFEPLSQSKGLVQKFSSKVADRNPGKVVMVRIEMEPGTYKYSLRRRDLDVDLGSIVKEMGVGGGIPPAAGCTVEDSGRFEKAFRERVLSVLDN